MLSLRALARWTPRTTSRIASYSTRNSSRPALQSFTRSNTIFAPKYQPLKASFSTTAARLDDVGQELAAKLNSEISIEQENESSSTDSDSNVQQFLEQNPDWQVEDKEGEQQVILRRTYDDEQITVSFSIADFNSPAMMPEDEVDEAYMDEEEEFETGQSGGGNTKGAINQGRTSGGNIKVAPEDSVAPADREELRNEEDNYDNQQAFPANVDILIQRPGRGGLRVTAVTNADRFLIQGIAHVSESDATATDVLRQPSDTLYTGPPFPQLDEEVQRLLQEYLDARGINDYLALFIPDYIDVKEQKEYIRWLERVKGFVD